MESNVICLSPRLILNRQLLAFLRLHPNAKYTIDARHFFRFRKHFLAFSASDSDLLTSLSRAFSQTLKAARSSPSLVDKCFFVSSDAEVCPLFIEVPCNHCEVCKDKKRTSFAWRCVAESSMHSYPPYFITLTYSNENLPSVGLDYSHVQKWLKRFRITLLRKYNFSGALRYACCGEYGKNTKRPHYHLLIWGLPYFGTCDFIRINEVLLAPTWKLGITQIKRCFNSDAGKYIGKYMTKKDTAPVGCPPPFVHGSCRNGGLGSSWCRSVFSVFSKNPNVTSLKYRDGITGVCKDMPLVKYFVDKLCPTFSKMCPKVLRDAYVDLSVYALAIRAYHPNSGLDASICSRLAGVKMPESFLARKYDVPFVSLVEVLDALPPLFKILDFYNGRDYSMADTLELLRSRFFLHCSRVSAPSSEVVQRRFSRVRRSFGVEKSRLEYL